MGEVVLMVMLAVVVQYYCNQHYHQHHCNHYSTGGSGRCGCNCDGEAGGLIVLVVEAVLDNVVVPVVEAVMVAVYNSLPHPSQSCCSAGVKKSEVVGFMSERP